MNYLQPTPTNETKKAKGTMTTSSTPKTSTNTNGLSRILPGGANVGKGKPKAGAAGATKPKPVQTPATMEGLSSPTDSAPQGEQPVVAAPDAGGPTPEQRAARIPMHQRVQRQLKIAAKRWSTFAKLTKGWSPEVDVAIAEVAEGMLTAIESVAKLPDTFTPPKRTGAGGFAAAFALEVGAVVNITDRCAPKYKDLLDDSDLKGLVLIKIANKKLVFRTQGGDRVFIPRGHVKPTGAKAAPAAAESAPAN